MTVFSKRQYFLVLMGIILLVCDANVKALSEDADYPIILQSGKAKTSFYVDGEFVGVGENGDLQVLIDTKKGHKFTAQTPGFNETSPVGIPPNYNYKGINDTVKLSFLYTDNENFKEPQPIREGDTYNISGVNTNGGNFQVGHGNTLTTIIGEQKDKLGDASAPDIKRKKEQVQPIKQKPNLALNPNHYEIKNYIEEFSDNICGKVQHGGRYDIAHIGTDAELKAELARFMQKLLSLGGKINLGGNYDIEKHIGVLQKDLATVLINETNCKLNVANKLIDKLISSS